MSVSKRGKRSGFPRISFRLDRDLTEFLKAQPEGVRAYLSELIKNDKQKRKDIEQDIKQREAYQDQLRQQLGIITDAEGRYNGGHNHAER